MPASPAPEPAGFPACARCPVRTPAPPAVCMGCVQQTNTVPALHCAICARPLKTGDACGNPVCGWGHRSIGRVEAICLKTGPVDKLIKDFKYKKVGPGWRVIFGRLVLGWLEEH